MATFLSQFYCSKDSSKDQQTSPFLIFILNFSDQEFAALETYLEILHKANNSPLIPIPLIKIHSSEASISNKRLDLYLKGGVFSVTYKILVLDLLTKRLSPSIISGLIINNAHQICSKGKSGETFIAEIVRKGN